MYSVTTSNKFLLEEHDKEENVGVTGVATTSSLKRRFSQYTDAGRIK
jgi:hypothetical protein